MLRTFRVLAQPAVPVIDLATAKAHLRVDFDTDDDLIQLHIDAATAYAEDYLDRSLITRQLGAAFSLPDLIPTSLDGSWWWGTSPGFGGQWSTCRNSYRLELPRGSVQAISAVSIIRGDTETVLDPTDYSVNIRIDPAAPRAPPAPGRRCERVYTAGYGDAPDAVPAVIRYAILLKIGHLYQHRGDTDEVQPQAVVNLLSQHRLVTFG